MRIREGVDVRGIIPELVLAMLIAREQYYGLEITSVRDGEHMDGSFHYEGAAFDFVHPGMSEAGARVLGVRLGSQYDVVFEGSHIHVEFDPD